MRHHANFVAIAQTLAELIVVYSFFNMAAVRHLGFVICVF